jgi:hypothetical protein
MKIQDSLEISALFEDVPPPGKKRVAVFIGRFNPPTKGHYAVINQVKKFIRDNPKLNLEAAPVVFIIGGASESDKTKNPLSVADRLYAMQHSGNANGVIFKSAESAFAALASLRHEDMEPIAIAGGSDRVGKYMDLLDKYYKNVDGSSIKHTAIELKRDEDAVETIQADKKVTIDKVLDAMRQGEGIDDDEISASLARRAAELDYFEEFVEITGLQKNLPLAKKIFAKVQASMKAGAAEKEAEEARKATEKAEKAAQKAAEKAASKTAMKKSKA